jgi:hypothetical protein
MQNHICVTPSLAILLTLEQFFIYKKTSMQYTRMRKIPNFLSVCGQTIYIYVGILPLNCQQQTAQLPLPIFLFCFSPILFNNFIFIL